MKTIPESHRDLLDGPYNVALSTVMPDGQPQITPVWWLPVILHFTWNFVENDLFNLTADSSNPNLIGALTRLQPPLTMSEPGWGNVIVVETLAFGIISLGVWLWLRRRPSTTPHTPND